MGSLKLLNGAICDCTACPRLVHYRETIAKEKRKQYRDWTYWGRPVPGFGDLKARLYILGLAPAAHGGNRTGRVFTGDRSGDWLYEALHRYGFANQASSKHQGDGLALTDCYIGATVRCAPPGNKPLPDEFDRCSRFLHEEIRLLKNHRVVIACRTHGHAIPAPIPKFGHGVMYHLPWGVTLLGSYHPSQQNTFTGKLTRQMFHEVFRKARKALEGP
jgi:uracil-DNA glycosylase family 4